MKKYFFHLLITFIFLTLQLKAQSTDKWQLGLRSHYGFILIHQPNMQQFAKAHFAFQEFSISRITDGEKDWHKLYHYPDIGLHFLTTDFGRNPLLGSAFALFPSITFHWVRKSNVQLNFRFGAGISYIQKPFNRLSNYKNNAIGSHWNSAVNLLLESKYKFNNRTHFGVGFAINHFSNGAIKLPNLGINLASVNLSLLYSIGKVPLISKDSTIKSDKKYEFFFTAASGIKEIAPAGGSKFAIINGSLNVAKVNSNKAKYGLAIDFMHDASIKEQCRRDQNPCSSAEILQIGSALFYELTMGDVSFPLQIGAYVHSTYPTVAPIYTRFGFRYHFNRNLFSSISLKTHYAKADYFEWGIGYSFQTKK